MAAVTLAAVGVGLSAYGAYSSYQGSQSQSAASQAQIAAEQRAEALRKRQMELEARRRTLEIVRNQQRTRAQALATATSQNASQGSGLQGAFGQISGQGNTQLVSTDQNLQIGRGLFDINQEISGYRSQYAEAGSQMAFGRGLMSLGSSLYSAAPQAGALAKGFGTPAAPTYGGYYNLAQTGGYPFPTPYRA